MLKKLAANTAPCKGDSPISSAMLGLSILTFIALRTCLKGTNLGGVEVIGSVSLEDLSGNWLATFGERLGSNAFQSARQYLHQIEGAGGILPRNDDLSTAERLALGNVLQAFHAELDAQTASLTPNERHWTLIFGDLANALTKKEADDSALETNQRLHKRIKTAFGTGEISPLLQPGQPEIADTLSLLFHTECLAWVEDEVQRRGSPDLGTTLPAYPADDQPSSNNGPTCPGLLRTWLLDPSGFSYRIAKLGDWLRGLFRRPPVQRPLIKGTLLQLWANSYLEQIKSNPRAFSQHMVDCLATLKGDQPRYADAVNTATLRIQESIASALGGIQQQLASLLGLTTEKFAELSAQLRTQRDQTHTLLTDLLTGHAEQSEAWQAVRNELGSIRNLLQEEHAPPLDDSSKEPTSAAGAEVSLSKLVYRERWLPTLLSRECEMQFLLAFLDSDAPYAMHILVGEAGTGKSRLAFELMLLAQISGWRAGFLQSGSKLDPDSGLHQWWPTASTLLIIDYASEQGASLPRALAQMSLNEGEFAGRLRILLIDRPSALRSLISDEGFEGRIRMDPNKEKVRQRLHLRRHLFGDALTAPYQEKGDAQILTPLQAGDWKPFLTTVFARAGHPLHALPENWEKDVSRATANGRPLMLMVLGLHYLRNDADTHGRANMDRLLDEVVASEVELRWMPALKRRSISEQKATELLPILQRVIAFITLTRGLFVSHMTSLQDFVQLSNADKDAIHATVEELLGIKSDKKAAERFLPLQPDLLGERFILNSGYTRTTSWGQPPKPFIINEFIPKAMELDPRGVVMTLWLVHADYPGDFIKMTSALLPHLRDNFEINNSPEHDAISAFLDHPIAEIWKMAFIAWSTAGNIRPLITPILDLLEWSKRSLASRQASWAIAIHCAEALRSLNHFDQQAQWDDKILQPLLHTDIKDFGTEQSALEAELTATYSTNAIASYSDKAPSRMDFWYGQIIKLNHHHSSNPIVIYGVAKGSCNAVLAYGRQNKWKTLEEAGDMVKKIAKENLNHLQFQSILAETAFNAVSLYAESNQWHLAVRWLKQLKAITRSNSRCNEIQLKCAYASSNAINHAAKAKAYAKIQEFTKVLATVCERDTNDLELQRILIIGTCSAVLAYADALNMKELTIWEVKLREITKKWVQAEDVIVLHLFGIQQAILAHAKARNWDGLVAWEQPLVEVVANNAGNSGSQIFLSESVFNVIAIITNNADVAILVRWAQILETSLPQALSPDENPRLIELYQVLMAYNDRQQLPAIGRIVEIMASRYGF